MAETREGEQQPQGGVEQRVQAEPSAKPAGGMLGAARGSLGNALLQRKLSRRLQLKRSDAASDPDPTTASAEAGPAPGGEDGGGIGAGAASASEHLAGERGSEVGGQPLGAAEPTGAHRTVASGSVGPDVAQAQARLNDHGATPALDEDGIFGPKTRAATLAFQNANGLAHDGIIGPHTWAALDTAGNQQRGQGRGGTPGAHSNVFYDRSAFTLQAPPPGTKLATVQAQVNAKIGATPPELTAAAVSGVKAGTEEEIFAWNALSLLGARARWGTEADLRTSIGWPKGTAPAPTGLITVRIDPTGKATAELLAGATVVGPTTFPDRGAAETRLKADFGFSEIKDGSATWTLIELGKVHAALSRLSGGERTALAGVALVREHTLTLDGQSLSGLFSHSSGVGQTGPATRSESLSLADSAFSSDSVSFVGGQANAAAASFETIVHEAGHAVETKALRDAEFDQLVAQAAQNQQTGVFNQANTDTNTAVAAFNAAQQGANGKAAKYVAADKKSMSPYSAALGAATTALSALSRPANSNGIAALQSAAVAAVGKRTAARAALAAANAKHPALADFAATDAAQDAWLAAAQARASELVKLDAAKTNTAAARAKATAAKGKGGHSKRLSAFIDFVNTNHILPFTEYARSNWPAVPDEFFAEAFSLFHTDPDFMQTNYKPLFDWFSSGEHLK